MVKYTATIQSKHPIDKVFEYLADFASAKEWDPGVLEASRAHDGPAECGSIYNLVSKFLWARVLLRYEIVEMDRPKRVVLRANGGGFSVSDTITFQENSAGTAVRYEASLIFSGLSNALSPLMQLVFNGVGSKAAEGLTTVLNMSRLPGSEQ
jgi:carbon monoxide dehydrogenase subunit G